MTSFPCLEQQVQASAQLDRLKEHPLIKHVTHEKRIKYSPEHLENEPSNVGEKDAGLDDSLNARRDRDL
jgi:hypothetical protein